MTPLATMPGSRTDWQAVNSRGTVLRTFADRDLARSWVKANVADHDGLVVAEVTTTVERRVDYRPRPPARRVFGSVTQGAMA